MLKIHPKSGYFVSDQGEIVKVRGNGFKVKMTTNCGYQQITLNGKTHLVHRVVVETFIGEIPKGMEVNHIDGDKSNNSLENLEIVTAKENIRHAYELGLKKPKHGEDNGNAKLTNEQYYQLISDILKGHTNDELALKYGLHSRYVSLIRGKKRVKSIWMKYESENGKKPVPMSSGTASKLSQDDRLKLLDDLDTMTNKGIAEKYNLDPSTVSNIRHKKIWVELWERKSRKGATTS